MFTGRVSKMGGRYYIAVPRELVEGGVLKHGERYVVRVLVEDPPPRG